MLKVEPTFAHKAISKLVELGIIKQVMTQNVDNLHRKSGVPRGKLIELHGNLQCEVCDTCGAEYERDFRIGPNGGNAHYTGRKCEREGCDGWLKDYLVPFGEDLPKKEVQKAWDASVKADFCLVIGSSMTVTPACDYAGWVGRKTDKSYTYPEKPSPKGDLCIVNIQKTPYDDDATVAVNGFGDDILRKLMEEMGIEC